MTGLNNWHNFDIVMSMNNILRYYNNLNAI